MIDIHCHGQTLPALNGAQLSTFIAMLSFSFFSSFHCAFMCGPLVAAVLGPKAHPRHYELWIYNLIRIFSYGTLGATLGFMSQLVGNISARAGEAVALVTGGILVAIGCLRLAKISLPKIIPPNFSFQGKLLTKMGSKPMTQSLGLGAITPFLPCMTLSPALIAAAGSGLPTTGGIAMIGFGLGTLPVMLLAPGSVGAILATIPRSSATIVANGFLILAGALTILRGLG